jgi:hypothetical protein
LRGPFFCGAPSLDYTGAQALSYLVSAPLKQQTPFTGYGQTKDLLCLRLRRYTGRVLSSPAECHEIGQSVYRDCIRNKAGPSRRFDAGLDAL